MEAAIEEVIDVARRSGVPLHLTHFHVSFAPGMGKAGSYLERIDEARNDGLDVTLDHYPYLAGSTFLAGLLPGWAHAGGTHELIQRLADAPTREKIRREMEETGSDGLMHVPADWEKIVLTGLPSGQHSELIGLNVSEIARRLGQPPMDCVAELLIEENLAVSCLIFCGHEENVRRVMRYPHCMMGTDGLLVGDRPHPRAWGTFPRFLGTYVRELGLLSLEECIRKMTSLAARRLGLSDRGTVKPGMAADLVVFDPDTVADTATYEHPRSFPTGMPYVIVNGELVKDDDQPTGRLPGRALRKRPHRDVE
jgi:N-acyl-D-amino-acid deacylase